MSPFFPSICKTAAFEPEGPIFGVLMFFAVFFGVLAIFCRYFQLDGIQEDAKETFLQNLKWINKVSLPFSVSCLISVVLVAQFRIPFHSVSFLTLLTTLTFQSVPLHIQLSKNVYFVYKFSVNYARNCRCYVALQFITELSSFAFLTRPE